MSIFIYKPVFVVDTLNNLLIIFLPFDIKFCSRIYYNYALNKGFANRYNVNIN